MDFGLAFSFAFKDPDWLKKIALAGLVSLIPIIGQIFIIGWGLEVTRRVIRHEPELLPDLDFGENLSKGFQAFVISLVYSIPIILFSLIINISTALAANQQNGDTAAVVIAAISVCCGGLMLIYGIALGFWIPAAFGNFVDKGQLSAGFNFNDILALIKAAPVAYLIVLLGSLVAGFVGSLGTIACVVGVIITYAYSMAVISHFYGQAYNQAKGY
ncbi:MAG: DUF4013 domain-containing protein [Chloroflexi bacterium]|jgi:hypothetical protein|nr:DUF4013 domain-containing protein [Anaerolineaceae bacterium]NMB86808.1 DUF4013 domain-containing protein [Chloroflexota bacterium]